MPQTKQNILVIVVPLAVSHQIPLREDTPETYTYKHNPNDYTFEQFREDFYRGRNGGMRSAQVPKKPYEPSVAAGDHLRARYRPTLEQRCQAEFAKTLRYRGCLYNSEDKS